jgi:hypothetical protein
MRGESKVANRVDENGGSEAQASGNVGSISSRSEDKSRGEYYRIAGSSARIMYGIRVWQPFRGGNRRTVKKECRRGK